MTNVNKEVLYNQIIAKFISFITKFSETCDFRQILESAKISEDPLALKLKCLEYSVYLILQIINKVVTEHRYPFRQVMTNLSVISNVAKLVNVNSKLINIEIVKFYKALLKSKDATYI
jgi:hypothetical protein